MRIHFVSAPSGSAFMHELLTVVAHEVEGLVTPDSTLRGVTVSEGPLPTGDASDVYVVVPHEYFVVIPPEQTPTSEQLRRTIGFCVEHPGNDTFETTVRFASTLAACVDINGDSTGELNLRGIPTERFVLGYSELWDAWHGSDAHRSLDMVYLGTTDPRRSRLLVQDFDILDDHELFLAIPPHEPMTKPRPDFFMGEAKHRLLADAKTLLNLHRGESRSLEWFRYLEAACNGCVVVSEHSPDFAPLLPGKHVLFGSPMSLPYLTRDLLSDERRLLEMRNETYSFLRDELSMKQSASLLCEVAGSVSVGEKRQTAQSLASTFVGVLTPRDPAGSVVREAVAESVGPPPPEPAKESFDPAPIEQLIERRTGTKPALEIVVVCRPETRDPSATIESVNSQIDVELSRVWVLMPGQVPKPLRERDGAVQVSDGSDVLVALETIGRVSGARRVLLLESGDRLSGAAFARLSRALDGSGADAAYGMVATADGDLGSALPFEGDRIQRLDYLELASLWERESLAWVIGANSSISSETGWIAELWRRLARRGGSATLVPRILVRQL